MMESKLKVVLLETEAKKLKIKSKLDSLASNIEFIQNESIENVLTKLSEGDIEMAVMDLSDIGKLSDELCIAALTERSDAHFKLYVRNTALDKSKDLRVKENATIAVTQNLSGKMVSHLRPDCEYNVIWKNGVDASEWVHDALITNFNVDPESHQKFDLHPSEFPPKAGKGVSAYLCRKDNLTLRKLLASIHETAVSVCTNVERSIENKLKEQNIKEAGIFCEQDTNGNYHVYLNYLDADGSLKSLKYSQSTNYQLGEKVIDLIKNN